MAPATLAPAWQPGLPGAPGAPPFCVPPAATPPARVVLLVNTAEGGTSGVTPTPANTGGVSGAAFDVVSVTGTSALTFDNTQAAHGTLSYKIQSGTSANAALQWTASAGAPQQTLFFRLYAFFTAWPNPASRLLNFRSAASAECAGILISTAGIIQLDDAGFVNRHSFTTAIPVNQWFRIEGYVTGDPVAGVISCSLFKSMDSAVADESFTATGLNTLGLIGQTWFGEANSTGVGPYWIDEIGVSNTGPLGPFAVTLAAASAITAVVTQDAGTSTALAGGGSVTANATVVAGSLITGAASVTAAVTQAAPAAAAGAAAVTDVVTQAVTAALAGAGAVTGVVTQAVTAGAAGAGAVTAKTVQAAGSAITAAGAVAGVVTEAVTAAPAGAAVVTANSLTGISGTAALAGAASVTVIAGQGASAAMQAAAAVTAQAVQSVTAALPGAGSVTALVTGKVTAAVAATAAVNATGIAVAPFTVGALSAFTAPAAALTAEIAASGDSIYTSLTYTAAYQAGGTPVPRLTTSTDAGANLGAGTSAAGVADIPVYDPAYAAHYGITPGGLLSATDARKGGPR